MYYTFHYDSVLFANLKINSRRETSIRFYQQRPGDFIGRDAYFSKCTDYQKPYDKLRDRRRTPWYLSPSKNKSVFVSSKSKAPRALLRGSDYSIVRDKIKADVVIIPELYRHQVKRRTYDILARAGERLVIITFQNQLYDVNLNNDAALKEQIKQLVINELSSISNAVEILDEWFNVDEDRVVWFLPKCEEYEEILTREYGVPYQFMFDTEVRITPTTNICPETLDIWSRCNDDELLEQSIMGSDWQDYPLTVALFLRDKFGGHHSFSEKFKYVLRAVHYEDAFIYDLRLPPEVEITPKDWNMYQDWLMYSLGEAGKDMAFVDLGRFCDMLNNSYERKMLKHKVAVSTYKIAEPVPYESLRTVFSVK